MQMVVSNYVEVLKVTSQVSGLLILIIKLPFVVAGAGGKLGHIRHTGGSRYPNC